MTISKLRSRIVVLVKALPQPSKTYGETVCCAGLTASGEWKRLFPVRYRHLSGENSFKRWDWVEFEYRRPTKDLRPESSHVFEDTISIVGSIAKPDRDRLLNRAIVDSSKQAFENGKSLALIRPHKTKFYWKQKSASDLADERATFKMAASQGSLLDRELAELEPSPYHFRFSFEDASGRHDCQNGDWEAHAMFWRQAKATSAGDALNWMSAKFNDEYPRLGMAFAMGNMAKRPQTWQLLGVIRLDHLRQGELF